MCILFVYTNPNPGQGKYQLVIATNRDEYFIRPAAAAHRWPEDELIIGGKDLEAGREGGTWFGMSLRKTSQFKLRVAALLNVTGEHRESGAAGRGSIVTDYLMSDLTAEDYVDQKLKPNYKTFNAFSFVAVELSDSIPITIHYTNVTNQRTLYHLPTPFSTGFGNSLLHEPFLKVQAGLARFQDVISSPGAPSPCAGLLELLRWRHHHLPDPVLARRAPDTQQHLSAVFVEVQQAGYGTRTHTVVTVDWEGKVEFLEETMEGEKWVRNEFQEKV